MKISSGKGLSGSVSVPGDKSISHRYAILGAMAKGITKITGYSDSEDCASTLDCLRLLGVRISKQKEDVVEVESGGWSRFSPPARTLDAGNSGTALRLLTGCLAASGFDSRIDGDASLRSRPMNRIVQPLRAMGADIEMTPNGTPPLAIRGRKLHGIDYTLPVASAQVKTCLILAGLMSTGRTRIVEPTQTRDHTERALKQFGGHLDWKPKRITLDGPQTLIGANVRVPGDFSGAAYLIAAALLVPGSNVKIQDVGLNRTRTGLLRLLKESGAPIALHEKSQDGQEPCGDIIVNSQSEWGPLPAVVRGHWIPNLIDELPLLAVTAASLGQPLEIREADELRKKESDRIRVVVENLRRVGVDVEELDDGLKIRAGSRIEGGRVATHGDHRIAMAFAIAGLASREGVVLDDAQCASVSFPGFFDVLRRLQGAP